MVQCEAINRLFIFISVVARAIIVSVLLLNHLSFLVIEELNRGVHATQPGMSIDLADSETLFRVDLKKSAQKITSLCRYVFFQQIFALKDKLVKLFHGLSLEWYCTVEHCEKNNSSTPQIDIKTIAPIPQYFRGNVSWRTTLFSHNLIRLNLP